MLTPSDLHMNEALGGVMGLLDGQHRDLDRASVLATELGLKATAAAAILERILRNPLVSSTLSDAATHVQLRGSAASSAASAAAAAADETAATSPERQSVSPSTSALRDLLERHGTPTLPLRSPRQPRQQQQQHRSHQPHRQPWSAAVRTPAHPDADRPSRLRGGGGGGGGAGHSATGVPSPPHHPGFSFTPPPFSLSPHRASASPACVPDGYDNDDGCDDGSVTFAEEIVLPHPVAADAASSRRRGRQPSATSARSSTSPEAEEWIDTAFALPPSPLEDTAAAAAAAAAAQASSPPLPSSTPTPRDEQPAGSPVVPVGPATHGSAPPSSGSAAPHKPPADAEEAQPPPTPPGLTQCLCAEAAGRSAVESSQGRSADSALRAFARAGVEAAEGAGRAAVCAEERAAVDGEVRRAEAAGRLLALWELQRGRVVRSEGVDRRLIQSNCAALAQAKRELRYSVGSTSARGSGGGGGGAGSDAGGSAASSSRTRLPCLAQEGREMVERHGSSSAGSVLQSSYGSLATATAAAAAAAAAGAAAVEGTDRFTTTKALDVAALAAAKLKSKEWKKKTDRSKDPPRPFYVHPASGRRVWDLEACLLEEARKEYRAQAGGAEHVLAARCDRCQLSYAGIPARWRCDGCGEGLAQKEADRAENVAVRFCAACGRDVSRAHPEKCATCGICGRLCCKACCALSLPLSELGYPPRMLLPVCTTCVPV